MDYDRLDKCIAEVSKLGKIPTQHLPQTKWLPVLRQTIFKIEQKLEMKHAQEGGVAWRLRSPGLPNRALASLAFNTRTLHWAL